MGTYKRDLPSIDMKIDDIPQGGSRVKIIGIILSAQGNTLMIGDQTGQLLVTNSMITKPLKSKMKGRFVLDIVKTEENTIARLLAFHELNETQSQLYERIMDLEKRIPK